MSDIMLRTLAEASQFLQQEEQVDAVSGTVLSKRLYSLLLKNVSKNDPLTQDELQELREFRATLSPEQWSHWLKFARAEKKKLSAKKEKQFVEDSLSEEKKVEDKNMPGQRKPSMSSSTPAPIEELREFIRRNSFKQDKVETAPPSSLQFKSEPKGSLEVADSNPSISTEELKAIIRRESIRLMKQNEGQAIVSNISESGRTTELNSQTKEDSGASISRRPSSITATNINHPSPSLEEPALVSLSKRRSISHPILLEDTTSTAPTTQSNELDYQSMENLVNRFHANQIRKKSIMHENFNKIIPEQEPEEVYYPTDSYPPEEEEEINYEEEKNEEELKLEEEASIHSNQKPFFNYQHHQQPKIIDDEDSTPYNYPQGNRRLVNNVMTPFSEEKEAPLSDPEPLESYYRRPSIEKIRRPTLSSRDSGPIDNKGGILPAQHNSHISFHRQINDELYQNTPDISFDYNPALDRQAEDQIPSENFSKPINPATTMSSLRRTKPPPVSSATATFESGVSLSKPMSRVSSSSHSTPSSTPSSRHPSNASEIRPQLPPHHLEVSQLRPPVKSEFERERTSLDLPSPPQPLIPRPSSLMSLPLTQSTSSTALNRIRSSDSRDEYLSSSKPILNESSSNTLVTGKRSLSENFEEIDNFKIHHEEYMGPLEGDEDEEIKEEGDEVILISKNELLQLQQQLLEAEEELHQERARQHQSHLQIDKRPHEEKQIVISKKKPTPAVPVHTNLPTATESIDSVSDVPSQSTTSFVNPPPPPITSLYPMNSSRTPKASTEKLFDNLAHADIGSRRLNSATSAAKYIIKSLNHFQTIGNLHPYESEGLEASKLILSEVVTALEKSKNNLSKIHKKTKEYLSIEEKGGRNGAQQNPLEEYEQELHSTQLSFDQRLAPLYSTNPGILDEVLDDTESVEDGEERDNYSELDEKVPVVESLSELRAKLSQQSEIPVQKEVSRNQTESQPAEKPQQFLQSQPTKSNEKPPKQGKKKEDRPSSDNEGKFTGNLMSALFPRIEPPSPAPDITKATKSTNRIPFQSLDDEQPQSDVESLHSYSSNVGRKKNDSQKQQSEKKTGLVNYPKENHFNTVFQQSLHQRDEDISRQEKEAYTNNNLMAEDTFMKTDELSQSHQQPMNLPPKRSRRESKYTHDVNNYTISFDADDIIQRIQSIDKSLSNQQGKVNLSDAFVAPGRRKSLIDPPTTSFAGASSASFSLGRDEGMQNPVYQGFPFVNTTEKPQEPSSNYVPKPYETMDQSQSSFKYNHHHLNNTNATSSPSSPLRMTRNMTTVQDEDQPRAQIEAYKAITQQYPDPIGSDQQRYQSLFDKYRMDSSGSITRLCLVQGPLVKAYEEYPIRIDLENSAVDVVWKEARVTSNQQAFTKTEEILRKTLASPTLPSTKKKKKQLESYYEDLMNSHTTKVLRRERFLFDYIYTGNRATDRLREYIKHRTKYSLTHVINQVYLCTSCGEYSNIDLEPPVTLALGSGGGSGIGSAILQEVFRFIGADGNRPANAPIASIAASPYLGNNTLSSSSGKYKSSTAGSYVTTRLVQDHQANRVTMSVVLTNGQFLFDLLHPTAATNANDPFAASIAPQILRKSTSPHRVILSNVTQIDLLNIYDFERIIGLLLGRRAGIFETLRNMKQTVKHPSSFLANTARATLQSQLLNSHATWNAKTPANSAKKRRVGGGSSTTIRQDDVEIDFGYNPNNTSNTSASTTGRKGRRKSQMDIHFDDELQPIEDDEVLPDEDFVNNAMDDERHVNMDTSSLLITFTVSYGSILAKRRNTVTFRLVCPCGDTWHDPGYDLNILAETIACLPNTPPPSMLTVSPLTMLLTDPTQSPCHYISVNNVIRREFNYVHGHMSESVEAANTIAMNSLSSLRIAAVPR